MVRSANELSDGGAGLSQPTARPPKPTFDFDERKLRGIIEAGEQARAALQDINERRNAAIRTRGRLTAALAQQRAAYRGQTNPDTEAQLEAAEREVRRLAAELEEARARYLPAMETARRCRDWAQTRGWTEDGRRGIVQPPRLHDPAADGKAAYERAYGPPQSVSVAEDMP